MSMYEALGGMADPPVPDGNYREATATDFDRITRQWARDRELIETQAGALGSMADAFVQQEQVIATLHANAERYVQEVQTLTAMVERLKRGDGVRRCKWGCGKEITELSTHERKDCKLRP